MTLPLHHEVMKLAEERALQGNAQFAIALGLLSLAREHRQLQENLTFGDGNAKGHRVHGVFEKMAMEMETIGSAISSLANAVDNLERD